MKTGFADELFHTLGNRDAGDSAPDVHVAVGETVTIYIYSDKNIRGQRNRSEDPQASFFLSRALVNAQGCADNLAVNSWLLHSHEPPEHELCKVPPESAVCLGLQLPPGRR